MIGVEEMALFDTLLIRRTVSVEKIITLLQQMILCDYISDVSRNLTFIIFIAYGNFIKLKTYDKFETVDHRLDYLNTALLKPLLNNIIGV